MNKHLESSLHTSTDTPDNPDFKLSHPKLSKTLQEFYDLSKSKYESKHEKLEMKKIMEAMGLSTKAVLLATDRETVI